MTRPACPTCAAVALRPYAEGVPLSPWKLADRMDATAAVLRAIPHIEAQRAAARISNDAACVRLMKWREG